MDNSGDKQWFAVYTKSRHEKKANEKLQEINIETFLPLKEETKKWSDRVKVVKEPLLRSYIFVHILPKNALYVIQTFGVVSIVKFNDNYAIIPDYQIEALRKALESDYTLKPAQYYNSGQLVEVTSGALKGHIGRIRKIKNETSFTLDLDAICSSFQITVKPEFLRPLTREQQKKYNIERS